MNNSVYVVTWEENYNVNHYEFVKPFATIKGASEFLTNQVNNWLEEWDDWDREDINAPFPSCDIVTPEGLNASLDKHAQHKWRSRLPLQIFNVYSEYMAQFILKATIANTVIQHSNI